MLGMSENDRFMFSRSFKGKMSCSVRFNEYNVSKCFCLSKKLIGGCRKFLRVLGFFGTGNDTVAGKQFSNLRKIESLTFFFQYDPGRNWMQSSNMGSGCTENRFTFPAKFIGKMCDDRGFSAAADYRNNPAFRKR